CVKRAGIFSRTVAARRAGHDQVEGCRTLAMLADIVGDFTHNVRGYLPIEHGYGAIPASGAAERRLARPRAAHPDRDARLLPHGRQKLGLTFCTAQIAGHVVIGAPVAEWLTAPHLG